MRNARPLAARVPSRILAAVSGAARRGSFVAVMAATAALTLAGFELYLRHTRTLVVAARPRSGVVEHDPALLLAETPRGRRLVPGSDVVIRNHVLSRRDVRMTVSSLGFRDEEMPAEKPPGERRVLVLGDSITWADYLDAEHTFVERTEALLREGGGGPVRVINAGVGDVGLREEVDILEERGLFARPDLVLVAFYLNDSRPPWGFEGEAGGRGWLRRHSVLADAVYKDLLLRRWISGRGDQRFAWILDLRRLPWMTERPAFLELAGRARHDWGAAWDPGSWAAIEAQLDRLDALARTHGFRVALACLPVAFQVYAQFLEDGPQREMAERARRRGLPFLDLLPVFREHRGRNLFFDHCHPNEEGNDLVARALAPFVAAAIPQAPAATGTAGAGRGQASASR